MQNHPAIFCALDTGDMDRAIVLAGMMRDAGCGMKLGLEFFNAQGPAGVRAVRDRYPELPLFLDLKYHDIPNTVAGAVRAVAGLGAAYINVHASGGGEMMRAALDAAQEGASKAGVHAPRVLAVTVLTSLDHDMLEEIGFSLPPAEQVSRLARLTAQAGLAGVVCSAQELRLLRMAHAEDFVLMVPGIRPAGADTQDQKRVMTPRAAIDAGATHLVIGRPITGAADPVAAARAILETLP